MKISISIDVSNLEKAESFYTEVLDCKKIRYQEPKMLVVSVDNAKIYIQEKVEGTNPAPLSESTRNYKRHWTPVHLDFYCNNLNKLLPKVIKYGGLHEGGESGDWGSIAFCSDPFGNGFCLIEQK